MFTGIIEEMGVVTGLENDGNNLHIRIKSSFSCELKLDQSVSHNGTCLTVVNIQDDEYTVTAIGETLAKTNLGMLTVGDLVNLERGMRLHDRLDGHLVQGHVDQTATCVAIEKERGGRMFTFSYNGATGNITVEKGSITVNGVSLTVVDSAEGSFSVAIIPYTFEHTNFCKMEIGNLVNLEFDILGKYVAILCKGYLQKDHS